MRSRPERRVAEELDRRGLAAPAALLVDAHRPLAPLIGDLAAAVGPLFSALLGRQADDVRSIAEDPDGLDRLTEELRKTSADAG
ncbi:MAG TPA: hypothetical protein VFW95_07870 [Candidatus Limnocylindria bacterium]|nr:hypothetical protein [Candidatus Limnocylindria bacterium]